MRWPLLILSLLLVLPLVSSLNIDFISPTPSNGSVVNKSIWIKANITTIGRLNDINFTFNTTTLNLYDKLILHWNFDNNTATGDNQTSIKDLSPVGNNGTIYGLYENITYSQGIYGKGINFTGVNNSGWIVYTKPTIDNKSNFTISVWIKPQASKYNGDYRTIIRFYGYSALRWLNTSQYNGKCYYLIDYFNKTGGSPSGGGSSETCPVNNWTHVVFIRKGDNFSLYTNGKHVSTAVMTGIYEMNDSALKDALNDYKIGYSASYPQFDRTAFNGTIDELMIWNRSLSDTEIGLLYNTQLTRINNSLYELNYNNSQLGNMRKQTYSIFANDTTTQNTTKIYDLYTNFITLTRIYNNNLIGIINNIFYGSNIHDYLSSNAFVDANKDGVVETPMNTAWQREKYLESKMGIMRGDMYWTRFYGLVNLNGKLDKVYNSSYLNLNTTGNLNNIATGWSLSTYNASGSYGQYAFINDSGYTGDYRLTVANNNTGGTNNIAFLYWIISSPRFGDVYNISIWINTSNNIQYKAAYNGGLYENCTYSVNTTGIWKQISCTLVVNDTDYTDIRFDINADKGETFDVDDYAVTLNGKEVYYNQIRSLSNVTNMVDWAYANNIRFNLIADTSLLAYAVTSNCYTKPLNNTCLGQPNYTEFVAPLIKDYLYEITSNYTKLSAIDLEISNEPYFYRNWYANISDYAYEGGIEYTRAYNIIYNYLKANNSNIRIGGPSGYRSADNLSKYFIDNATGFDFIAIHPYTSYEYVNTNQLVKDVEQIFGLCKNYSVTCNNISATEWGIAGNETIRNKSLYNPEWAKEIAYVYLSILNTYPSNISLHNYQWTERYSYYSNQSVYPEYPDRWSMVSEPSLDNEIYTPFNVTKQFATYHPSGATVVNSTSDYDKVKVVATKLQNVRMVTVINTDTDSVNVTLDLGENVTTLYKASTGEIFTTHNDGLFYLGVLESYDVTSFYGSVAYPYREEVLCNDTLKGLSEFANLLPLLIVVAMGGILVIYLMNNDSGDLSPETIGIALVSMIVAVVIGSQIISRVGGC